MKECIFCSIADKNEPFHEIIWESDSHIAFLDINPSKDGHTLVIPKKHSVFHTDLSQEEYTALFSAVREVSGLLKEKLSPDLVAVVLEGFHVPHTHVHLIPLHKGEQLAQFENHLASAEELSYIADNIRQ